MKDYKILLGDSFPVVKSLSNNCFDVAFTSPPYNRKRNDKYKFYDDNIEDYFGFLCRYTEELMRICNKYVILNIQKNYYQKSEVFKYIGKYADKIQDIVVWEKSNPLPTGGFVVNNAYEFFIILSDIPLKSNYKYTKNHITTAVNSDMAEEHKAIMRQDVSDWFISRFTSEGDSIIDPFMGFGTTGISCLKYNRKFMGIEIIEEYYNEAERRLSNFFCNKRLF